MRRAGVPSTWAAVRASTRRTSAAALLVVAVAAANACADGAAGTAGARFTLTNADEYSGRSHIGQLILTTGGVESGCTGTLVGARTVLTAAHCLGFDTVEFGIYETRVKYDAVETHIHPGWEGARPWEHDLGLAVLDRDMVIEHGRVSDAPVGVDEPVTLIGYGETAHGAGDEGVKRIATNRVSAVEALYFETGHSVATDGNGCTGDSGGPVLVELDGEELVAGIMSYVPDLYADGCGTRMWSVRLDPYLDWLRTAAGGDIDIAEVAVVPPDAGPPAADAGDAGSVADGSLDAEDDAGAPGTQDAADAAGDGGAGTEDGADGAHLDRHGGSGCGVAPGPRSARRTAAIAFVVGLLGASRRRRAGG